jgi:hypothetical protein
MPFQCYIAGGFVRLRSEFVIKEQERNRSG